MLIWIRPALGLGLDIRIVPHGWIVEFVGYTKARLRGELAIAAVSYFVL
jgi:hypothetical protein